MSLQRRGNPVIFNKKDVNFDLRESVGDEMRIAVCDDEKFQRDYLIKLLNEWDSQTKAGLRISAFPSAESFWFAHSEEAFDGLLLDIQMKGQNGMEFARSLRSKGDSIPIIFITGFDEFIGQGYEVDAVHYLLKPVEKEKLFGCLDKLCSKRYKKLLTVETTRGIVKIAQEDIFYAEAFGHTTSLHCKNETLTLNSGISKLEKNLNSSAFCRCHRSYLVNISRVLKTDRETVTLENGETLPMSRRMYDDFQNMFIKYYKGDKSL